MQTVEKDLNRIVRKFGLDYQVILVNNKDVNERGWIDIHNKIIYVNTSDPEEAYRILLHEIIEIKVNPLLNRYIRIINSLMNIIQRMLYEEKERVIEELVDLFTDSDRPS